MLRKLTVRNFKNFKEDMTFDLTKVKDYRFNTFAIKNKLLKTGLIYGENGAGKSNLGLALFDLTTHLTSKEQNIVQKASYLNGDSDEEHATFKYEIEIDGLIYRYEYTKSAVDKLLYEVLYLSDKKVFSYNFLSNKGDFSGIYLVKAQNLRFDEKMNMSIVRFIAYNSNISLDNPIHKFMQFVSNMLWFRSTTEGNAYIGFAKGSQILAKAIIDDNKVKDFEKFLHSKGINMNLGYVDNPVGDKILVAKYKHRTYDFFDAASNGTKVMLLYYYWLQKLSMASFVFIDEFDAFFHTDLAQSIYKEIVSNIDAQIFITTHNTDLMSNHLLRPDCYFIINEGEIKSLPECSDKELRSGHNLEKMYKSGEFELKDHQKIKLLGKGGKMK